MENQTRNIYSKITINFKSLQPFGSLIILRHRLISPLRICKQIWELNLHIIHCIIEWYSRPNIPLEFAFNLCLSICFSSRWWLPTTLESMASTYLASPPYEQSPPSKSSTGIFSPSSVTFSDPLQSSRAHFLVFLGAPCTSNLIKLDLSYSWSQHQKEKWWP